MEQTLLPRSAESKPVKNGTTPGVKVICYRLVWSTNFFKKKNLVAPTFYFSLSPFYHYNKKVTGTGSPDQLNNPKWESEPTFPQTRTPAWQQRSSPLSLQGNLNTPPAETPNLALSSPSPNNKHPYHVSRPVHVCRLRREAARPPARPPRPSNSAGEWET